MPLKHVRDEKSVIFRRRVDLYRWATKAVIACALERCGVKVDVDPAIHSFRERSSSSSISVYRKK